jgi:hypothetical protein
MATLLGTIKQRFFELNGAPLAGGKLYSFEAGTSTPLATFTDESGGVANDNPVILDSGGYADIWLGGNQYKFVLYDSEDNLLLSTDNISVLNNETVTASSLADGAVTTPKLADGSVTTPKLADDAVTSVKIADSGVATNNLAANAVTTAKIAANAVTTAKIADNTVTTAKMAASNIEVSTSGTGTFANGSGSAVDVTNLTDSITTNGRPVFIKVQANGANASYIQIGDTVDGATAEVRFRLFRGATEIAEYSFQITANASTATLVSRIPPGCLDYIDQPSAGTYTYKFTVEVAGANDSVTVNNCELVLVEL